MPADEFDAGVQPLWIAECAHSDASPEPADPISPVRGCSHTECHLLLRYDSISPDCGVGLLRRRKRHNTDSRNQGILLDVVRGLLLSFTTR